MNQSPELDELFTALAKAQSEMDAATLDSANPFFKSKYASFNELVRVSRPSLTKHGLSVLQQIIPDESGNHLLVTKLCHASGQWVQSGMKINPIKQDVQAIGSYITYLKRYSYAALVGVVIDDESDDDGNAAVTSHKQQETVPLEKSSPPKQYINYEQKLREEQKNNPITQQQLEEINHELEGYHDIKKMVLSALTLPDLAFIPAPKYRSTIDRIREIKRARESVQ